MKKDEMRTEYDLSKGQRGRFYDKVDTKNPVISNDETLDEAFDEELHALESSLSRIKKLRPRLSELDQKAQKKVSKRIANASDTLEEISLSR